jgi:hypothetical protein
MSNTTTTTIKPGDIWRSLWGCEQTNAEFYEVTRVTKTTVTLARLETVRLDNGDMTGLCKPTSKRTNDKPIRRKVQWYDGKPYAKLGNYSMAPIARPYDGRVTHYSTYA